MNGGAATLCLIAEHWLTLLERSGGVPPGRPDVVAALTEVALAAPLTAARLPRLLRLTGLAAGGLGARPAAHRIDTADAAQLLGLTTDGVRYLLRHGRLAGHRDRGRWAVDTRSVLAYGARRARGDAARAEPAAHTAIDREAAADGAYGPAERHSRRAIHGGHGSRVAGTTGRRAAEGRAGYRTAG